ncbi:hypothetical protein HKX48_001602 [Thoreauomyces humboldtii]|nr:hypothetical protein HKX48_001602 [Thoreauomyces humboldtii]
MTDDGMQSLMAGMDKVTPDGGILKITLREPEDKSRPAPSWFRGVNARFHYSVFLYSPEGGASQSNNKSEKPPVHDPNCSHDHSHDHHKDHDHAPNPRVGSEGGADGTGRPVRRKVADSRDDGQEPFELRIGYRFSVRAMELAVTSMRVGEKARFLCMPEYCEGYVQLAKVLKQEKENRENAKKGLAPKRIQGCCAHAMAEEMEAQEDLAELHGVPLEFEIELMQVQMPDDYVREPWEMETIDKYREAPIRKDEGAELYKRGKYELALEKYTRALSLLESVSTSTVVQDMTRKSEDENGHQEIKLETLASLTRACRLNYAACKLKLQDYPPVVVQCTEVLNSDPTNVKAVFRRGQAYTRIGRDLDLAQADYERMESLLEKSGNVDKQSSEWKELRAEQLLLQTKLKAHREKERKMFGNMFG